MKILRLSLVGTVTLLLVGAMPLGATAQEDESMLAGTSVTGKIVSEENWSNPESATSEAGMDEALGMRVERQIEWSDPRLPSEFRSVVNLHANEIGMATSASELYEGGDWTGRFTGVCDNEDNCWGLSVLTGHGDHAGLSAVIVTMAPEDPTSSAAYKGFIFEGEMPPMPDPVEPSAE